MSLNIKDLQKEKLLGKGGQGEVWLVTDKKQGKQFALKQISVAKKSLKEGIALTQEVALTISMKHPNVVEYLDYVADDDYLYILMEYMDAGDLSSFQTQLISEELILKYFQQAMQAIAFVHQRGVVHRDMKPANILMKKNGSEYIAKLADFGLAKKSSAESQAQTYCGTMNYMAPEVWECDGYSNKVDIWSMGCILYEMCIGEPPFKGTGMVDIFKAIQKSDITPIPQRYSSELRCLIAKMMQMDPAKRPSAAEVLASPVFRKSNQLSKSNFDQNNNEKYAQLQVAKVQSTTQANFQSDDIAKTQITKSIIIGTPTPVVSVSAKDSNVKGQLSNLKSGKKEQKPIIFPVDTVEELKKAAKDPKFQHHLDLRRKFAIADSDQQGFLDALAVADFYQQFELDEKFAKVITIGILMKKVVGKDDFDKFDDRMEEIQMAFQQHTEQVIGYGKVWESLQRLRLNVNERLIEVLVDHFGKEEKVNFAQFARMCATLMICERVMGVFDEDKEGEFMLDRDVLMRLGTWFDW